MIGMLFMFLLFLLGSGLTLLFGVLAYNNKNNTFFILAIVFGSLFLLQFAYNFEYNLYQLMQGNITQIGLIAAWIIGIVFTGMSKTEKGKPEEITEAYLDEIINAPDEEWDPES